MTCDVCRQEKLDSQLRPPIRVIDEMAYFPLLAYAVQDPAGVPIPAIGRNSYRRAFRRTG
jgi:hypothetical protein